MAKLHTAQWSPGAAGPLLRLIDGDLDAPDWHGEAVCATVDGDLWFAGRGGGTTKLAKAICAACPSRLPCLEEAIEQNERFGVRGGLSVRERDRLAHARNAGAAA
jgi:WhiB family redox-sensing transcriptional regulator